MSQQTRTPRQRQGDGLVQLKTMVTPKMLQKVNDEARLRKCPQAEVVRLALVRYFYDN